MRSPPIAVSSSDDEEELTTPMRRPPQRRRSHVVATMCGISSREFRRCVRFGVPMVFFQTLAYLHFSEGWQSLHMDCGEWMCGVGVIQSAFAASGLESFGYDRRTRNPLHDILTGPGWMMGLSYLRCSKFFSLHHWGILCSSWVWISRSVSGRSLIDPLGDQQSDFACEGNTMVTRMIMFCLFIFARLGVVLIEQPSTSLMSMHPRWHILDSAVRPLHKLLRSLDQADVRNDIGYMQGRARDEDLHDDCDDESGLCSLPTWLGGFGSEHSKRVLLYCSVKSVLLPLHRTLPKTARERLGGAPTTKLRFAMEGKRVVRKVTGNKQVLKGTQEYPVQFGHAVLRSYQSWRADKEIRIIEESSDSDYELTPTWPDAKLEVHIRELSQIHPNVPRLL